MLTAIEVLLDDLLVHHQSVLVHHRLKNIDYTALLLRVMTDFTHSNWVNLVQHWHEQLVKHAITEFTLNNNFIDLFFLSDACQFLWCFL